MQLTIGLVVIACSPPQEGPLPTTGPTALSADQMTRCAEAADTLVGDTLVSPKPVVPHYWPPGTFREPDFDNFVQTWYSTQLCAMGELAFSQVVRPTEAGIRFLWLRSFHPGVVVRVAEQAGVAILTATQLSGAGGYAPGVVERQEQRELSREEWDGVLEMLRSIDFWLLPTNPNDDLAGVDGGRWIIEATDGSRYHVVDRWSGGELEALGTRLLQLSMLEPDPIY